ncbi:MAG: hypothetical protein IPG68_13315 [Micrococcales bacterium]|nr:hypothetical protein [Micrococcales bacterium]
MAADLTIGEVLPFDAGLPQPRQVHQAPNRSAEEYFRLLRARPVTKPPLGLDPDHTCGSGSDGMAREHDLPPGDAGDAGAVHAGRRGDPQDGGDRVPRALHPVRQHAWGGAGGSGTS